MVQLEAVGNEGRRRAQELLARLAALAGEGQPGAGGSYERVEEVAASSPST
jgi:hypothetical protein